ncbi:MAG: DeoR/GlpR transcriptional regulator [Phycisphaerae bacterium]|nr:DeoR/GlpR transcriptional regulator [Phycisphaerae bacterium]
MVVPRMISDERRQRLIRRIAERGFVDLPTLAKEFGVSESTIRRDLAQLDEEGLVKRTHGGAVFISDRFSALNFAARESTALEEKRAIGRRAAELIRDDEIVLINGGTTTHEVARALVGRPMRVVTNSLPIANTLGTAPEIELTVVGGYLYPRTGVTMGPLARKALESLHVNKMVMGCAGVTDEGYFNANALMVEIEQQMMECADEVVLVVDSSKFGRAALARICELDVMDHVICDDKLGAEWQDRLRSAGVELLIAPAASSTETPAEAR